MIILLYTSRKKGELSKRSPGFVINEGNTSWKKIL